MLRRSGPYLLIILLLICAITTIALAWEEGDNVQLNTDGTTQLQNEESLCINPVNSDNVLAMWRDFRLGYRRIGIGTSFDGGQTWSDSLFVGTPYTRHSDPVISYAADGTIYACVLSYDDGLDYNGLFIFPSTDGGMTWDVPITIVDQTSGAFEDKQWINVDRTGGTYDGRIYVPWTRFTQDSRIMLCYSISTVVGPIFQYPVFVSDATSVQWPTVTIGPDGTVYVAWFSYAYNGILIDKSTNGGVGFGTDHLVQSTEFYPSNIDGGIQTFAFPAMEADITGGSYNGNIYIIFEDLAADDKLDVYLTKSTDGGDSWSERHRINDDPYGNAIDQFHPWVSINEDGILTAVWYDRRNDPGNLYFDLYLAHSFDGGDNWTANRRISTVSSSPFDAKYRAFVPEDRPTEPEKPGWTRTPERGHQDRAGLIGEYVGLSSSGDKVNTAWTDTRNGNQDVFSTRVTIGFSAPPLIAPEANTVTSDPEPIFVWGKVGATPSEIALFPGTVVQPLYYVLEIDDDPLFLSVDYVDSNLVGTSKQVSPPLSDGNWYWRVSAVNDSGRATGYSEPLRLITIDQTPPSLPELVEPAVDDTVSYEEQNFSWTAVNKDENGTAVEYQLQVDDDQGFGSPAIDTSSLTSTSFSSSGVLSAGTAYFWRVRPYDLAGNSPGFTGSRRFFTAKSFLCGDADSNELVNISDAVYLISYIFGAGTAPDPLMSGDVDCNQIVNISDAVYLISYIFGGGPAPCANCP
jgi:hypothetical protein